MTFPDWFIDRLETIHLSGNKLETLPLSIFFRPLFLRED